MKVDVKAGQAEPGRATLGKEGIITIASAPAVGGSGLNPAAGAVPVGIQEVFPPRKVVFSSF